MMKNSFSIILIVCVLMVIGAALIPQLDISNKPRPVQGKTLSISYRWNNAPAKVVEQNITSRIEALVSSVKGVRKVSSVSKFGSGIITVELKPKVNVSQVRFEIAQILRHARTKLPEDMSFPIISGGEADSEQGGEGEVKHVLTWQMYADMSDEQLYKILETGIKRELEHAAGVHHVEVTGASERYMEISYDAEELAGYGLNSSNIVEAVRNYAGREYVIGEVVNNNEKNCLPLILRAGGQSKTFEEMPLTNIGEKIIYLNDLVSCKIKDRLPSSYYRVNGMNTVYVKVYAERDAQVISVVRSVNEIFGRRKVQSVLNGGQKIHHVEIYDRAAEELKEFNTLMWRTMLTLAILLFFAWLSSGRSFKYLAIVGISLSANILIAVILYYLLNIRMHPVSLAGITVSLGLIIDSTIVMTDHYSYNHNRGAFFGILGAMLTTVGGLSVVGWLPEELRKELNDFALVMGVNLSVAAFIASYFVPALIYRLRYNSKKAILQRTWRTFAAIKCAKAYRRYVDTIQHRAVRSALLAVIAICFAYSLKLFIESLATNRYQPKEERMSLKIRAQMPIGGSVQELNEKVRQVEQYLTTFNGIQSFETKIAHRGAYINIEFTDSALETSFPYMLENRIIGKVITIGGADWATWGVSERGFSNSLNLQYRANGLDLSGYDYDRLCRFAEDLCKEMKKNNRVVDLAIVTPEYEEQENEVYVEYDKINLSLDSVSPQSLHTSISNILSEREAGEITGGQRVVVRPIDRERFDLWRLKNSYINQNERSVMPAGYMDIAMREAKNIIPRENQEYVLRVAFNILGSYTYTERYLKRITNLFNSKLPIGFHCKSNRYMADNEARGLQYWLVGLIAVIIFFVIAIMTESLYEAFCLTLLIPLSFIGLFLAYYITEVPFGTGGLAAMVLLAGLAVNSGIYIMYEYRRSGNNTMRGFITAVKHKVVPVVLTTLSTILGMIPFLFDGYEDQPFWFSLATGTIGGLVIGTITVFLALPLFVNFYNSKTKVRKIIR